MCTDAHEFFENRIRGKTPSLDDYRRLVELLWKRYAESVFLFAYAWLKNYQDARDVVNDSFVKAMEWLQKNPGKKPPKVNFPAWLRRIARNLIIDMLRRRGLIRQWPMPRPGAEDGPPPYAEWPDTREFGPVEQLIVEEELEALRKCIELLPERKRRLVVLHDINGLTHAAIGETLGMPASTVGVTIHRARKELRRCVELRLAL